jgi:hypothetical protein
VLQGDAPAGAPKGFPVALWKPSVRTPVYWFVLLLDILLPSYCLKEAKGTQTKKAAITAN